MLAAEQKIRGLQRVFSGARHMRAVEK